MPDIITALILVIPPAWLAWFAWTCTVPYQRKKKSAALEKLRASKRYRGVTIRNGKCAAVHRYSGSFYSLDDVPELPVKGCKALRCSCVYTGLNNRRYLERRSGADPRTVVRFEGGHSERRTQRDRRKDNRVNWQDPAD